MLIDTHLHLGMGDVGIAELDRRVRHGLTDRFWMSALHGGNYPTLAEVRSSNDAIHGLMREMPEHVIGFSYVNPENGTDALTELRRCVEELGFKGVKLWVATRCDDPRVDPIVEQAIAYGAPILVHCWAKVGGGTAWGGNLPFESTPMDLGNLASRFARARFIMAHLGGHWQYGVQVARDHPNIWVDTSGSIAEMGSIETLVNAIGAERVLFGTDNSDLSFCIGKIIGAGLSLQQREAIFWRNAHTLVE